MPTEVKLSEDAPSPQVHPLVWAAIGGGVVALLAWALAMAISIWQPPSAAPAAAATETIPKEAKLPKRSPIRAPQVLRR